MVGRVSEKHHCNDLCRRPRDISAQIFIYAEKDDVFNCFVFYMLDPDKILSNGFRS